MTAFQPYYARLVGAILDKHSILKKVCIYSRPSKVKKFYTKRYNLLSILFYKQNFELIHEFSTINM